MGGRIGSLEFSGVALPYTCVRLFRELLLYLWFSILTLCVFIMLGHNFCFDILLDPDQFSHRLWHFWNSFLWQLIEFSVFLGKMGVPVF